jgi:hypothetical protein
MTRSPIASSRGMFQTASSRGSRRATFADGSLLYIYIYIYIKEEDIQVLFWGSFMVAGMISN